MQINLNDFTVEELYKKMSIENVLKKLESKDMSDSYDALKTLANIFKYTKQNNALYILCGYYILNVHTKDELSFFITYTKDSNSYQLFKLILKDVSQEKDFYRRKDTVDNMLSMLSSIIYNKITKKEEENIISLIEDSQWGVKMKKKFLDKFIVEDLEQEKFNYLFGDL